MTGKPIATYHGATLQCTDFQPVRDGLIVKDRGATAKAAYRQLRENLIYSVLPEWSKASDVETHLRDWERTHPDACTRKQDDGQFFGFREVATGYLGRYTRFLFIPAVRDATDDAQESKGSVISELMDLVVRNVLSNKESLKNLREHTQHEYASALDPSKLDELERLARNLTKTLQVFVPESEVDLGWLPLAQIDIPMPKANVKLVEDGYKSPVGRTGHGLQRAFILTMLQHLVLAKSGARADTPETGVELPDLVLAIEEPELYQHPSRQRHFARILRALAAGSISGVAKRTQIVYGTHSPLFVGLDRISELRLLRKSSEDPGLPKVTTISSVSLSVLAEKLWTLHGRSGAPFSESTLLSRLRAIMTPWMNEGFFANVVVLVEGEDDRSTIMAAAQSLGIDFEAKGIAIIPCFGKKNIDRPYLVFSALRIPVYPVWDSDAGRGETEGICEKCLRPLDKRADPNDNRFLLRLVGEPEEDWPSAVGLRYACFERDLETTLSDEIGIDAFETALAAQQVAFGIERRSRAIKNPVVLEAVLRDCEQANHKSPSLIAIVKAILALRESAPK